MRYNEPVNNSAVLFYWKSMLTVCIAIAVKTSKSSVLKRCLQGASLIMGDNVASALPSSSVVNH